MRLQLGLVGLGVLQQGAVPWCLGSLPQEEHWKSPRQIDSAQGRVVLAGCSAALLGGEAPGGTAVARLTNPAPRNATTESKPTWQFSG